MKFLLVLLFVGLVAGNQLATKNTTIPKPPKWAITAVQEHFRNLSIAYQNPTKYCAAAFNIYAATVDCTVPGKEESLKGAACKSWCEATVGSVKWYALSTSNTYWSVDSYDGSIDALAVNVFGSANILLSNGTQVDEPLNWLMFFQTAGKYVNKINIVDVANQENTVSSTNVDMLNRFAFAYNTQNASALAKVLPPGWKVSEAGTQYNATQFIKSVSAIWKKERINIGWSRMYFQAQWNQLSLEVVSNWIVDTDEEGNVWQYSPFTGQRLKNLGVGATKPIGLARAGVSIVLDFNFWEVFLEADAL